MTKPQTLLDGLCFGEGPRWRDNKLWFSDMHAHQVVTVDMAGNTEVITEVPNQPSGLGWLPDGRLLIVSMADRRLLRLENDGQLVEAADLSTLSPFHCNDMVVDAQGRAYVGNFGFDLHNGAKPAKTNMLMVTPEGGVSVAAEDLSFPNGTVITPDGKTLIVGESFGGCLTAFDIGNDGMLSNRRLWAQLEGAVPDGIALDADNGIWVASPSSAEALRVKEGGKVTDRVPVETQAFACMLGGPERRTLFILTAKDSHPDKAAESKSGRVEIIEVEHPGAGLP
ncbi:MAG: SMP-30/gluconolactonase/LRE family protein [Pseudomonadota bacterium]